MSRAMGHQPGTLRAAWYRWKKLKLPWRRKWLVGYDLSGRTFWEFQNQLNPGRPRRIVQYPRGTHYGDVAFTPAWLQWLRQTRPDAPSVEEQQFELQRQSQLKQLALAADERWRSKESFLDSPKETGQVGPPLQSNGKAQSAGYVGNMDDSKAGKEWQRDTDAGASSQKPSPWEEFEHKQGTPGQAWQPDSWKPAGGKSSSRS